MLFNVAVCCYFAWTTWTTGRRENTWGLTKVCEIISFQVFCFLECTRGSCYHPLLYWLFGPHKGAFGSYMEVKENFPMILGMGFLLFCDHKTSFEFFPTSISSINMRKMSQVAMQLMMPKEIIIILNQLLDFLK